MTQLHTIFICVYLNQLGLSECHTMTLKVVPYHKPPKILKFNFSENDITEKPPFNPYARKI